MTTSDLDHPGYYREYVEAWNFDFDIMDDPDDPNKFQVAVKAVFAAGAA